MTPAAIVVLRKRLHLTQAAFGALLDVSIQTVQAWEQGRHAPSEDMAKRIAAYAGRGK